MINHIEEPRPEQYNGLNVGEAFQNMCFRIECTDNEKYQVQVYDSVRGRWQTISTKTPLEQVCAVLTAFIAGIKLSYQFVEGV